MTAAELLEAPVPAADQDCARDSRGLLWPVVAFVLLAGGTALVLPSLLGPDEPAHLGYVKVLLEGRLPTIDTPNPVSGDFILPDIWVATHPPLFYVLSAPLVALGAGAAGLRLVSIAAAAAGVWLVGMIARDLSDDRRLRLGAMWLAALCPHLIGASAYGQTDGPVFAAAAAAVLVCVRAVKGRPLPTWVAVAVVVAACLTKAVLLVAVPLVAACYWPRWRTSLAVLAGAAVGAGWWYVRNIALYGDPTASEHLFEKFERASGGSMTDVLLHPSWLGGAWQDMWSATLNFRIGSGGVPVGAPSGVLGTSFVLGGIVLVGIVLSRPGPRLLWAGWTAGVVLGMAQFVSGGGSPHGRYLLPLLPIAAVLAADGFGRLHRLALPAVVTTFGVLNVVMFLTTWHFIDEWVPPGTSLMPGGG